MKTFIYFSLVILVFSGCSQPSNKEAELQNRVDSLENAMNNVYKPGFGEFMGNIQGHHIKLWYAGINRNWKLADFELKEIRETVEDIQKFESDREESKVIGMLEPALDNVDTAIARQDPAAFKANFQSLTNTCNACHKAVHFEFNVVKIPDSQPFSNQEFKPSIK